MPCGRREQLSTVIKEPVKPTEKNGNHFMDLWLNLHEVLYVKLPLNEPLILVSSLSSHTNDSVNRRSVQQRCQPSGMLKKYIRIYRNYPTGAPSNKPSSLPPTHIHMHKGYIARCIGLMDSLSVMYIAYTN